MMGTAVVDVGGGLRGIYAAVVLDRCLDDNVCFSAGIGVSAGSANIASYIAGQRGRNYHFYAEYSLLKEYMSAANFLNIGSPFTRCKILRLIILKQKRFPKKRKEISEK